MDQNQHLGTKELLQGWPVQLFLAEMNEEPPWDPLYCPFADL